MFTLTIETGNDAMQTREDVARALREVAEALDGGREGGYVRDLNGNTVGSYELALGDDSRDPALDR